MIKFIKIDSLYNMYSYNIVFDKDPNILILTGPNGFGKTTILQIIHCFSTCNLWYFYYIPFGCLWIEYVDGYSFKITQHEDKERTGRIVCIEMYIGEDKVEDFSITSDYISYLLKDINQFNRFIEEEHEEDVLSKYYNPLRDEIIKERLPSYVDFLKSQKCVMVEEQRLKTTTRSRYQVTQNTVEEIQKKIELFFAGAQKMYNQESLKIDGSFIKRLSDLQEKNDVQLKHIKRERIYQQVTSIIKDYQKYGLVKELNVVSDLGVHYNGVLKLYLNDLRTKLDSIKSFYQKLSTFDRLVSGKKLSYKKVIFEDDKLLIRDANENEVPIRKLSSGEQNLVILCYKLVFELTNKSILLVDEPENSLHVAWLDNLLKDYLSIAKTTGCQIIIATHSPAFIHGNWELTYDLCENEILHNS